MDALRSDLSRGSRALLLLVRARRVVRHVDAAAVDLDAADVERKLVRRAPGVTVAATCWRRTRRSSAWTPVAMALKLR